MQDKDINKDIAATDEELSKAKKFRSFLDDIYYSDKRAINKVEDSPLTNVGVGGLDNQTLIDSFSNIGGEATVRLLRQYSEEAYAIYPEYTNLINYYANMYTWQYIYVPKMLKENKTDYNEIYKLMTNTAEGINIPIIFPYILTELFVKGAVYFISSRHNKTGAISTQILPTNFCKPIAQTEFGTIVFQLNLEYFDNMAQKVNKEEFDSFLDGFPAEILAKYSEYRKNKSKKWIMLDPRYSSGLILNAWGIPTFLKSVIDIKYNDIMKKLNVDKKKQDLQSILVHKLPVWQDKLILTLNESKELHTSIKQNIIKNEYTKLITTFGEVEQVKLNDETSTKENKTLKEIQTSIFNSFGINSNLFSSDKNIAIEASLNKDAAFVWKYIEQLVLFFNISLNNLINFKGYQIEISILPVTWYNREKMIDLYREQSTLGISKLEYIVSAGLRQSNIAEKIELENKLNLNDLKPLTTSYTQPGEKESVKQEREDKEKEADKDGEEQEEDAQEV